MSGDALANLTVEHLVNELGFIARGEVIGGFAVRAPRAYPSYTLGYREPLDTLNGASGNSSVDPAA